MRNISRSCMYLRQNRLIALLMLLGAGLAVQAIEIKEVSPAIREHLEMTLREMEQTKTGKAVLQRVAPELVITAKVQKELGRTGAHNVITLESLRMDNGFLPETAERQKRIKLCFTAEILTHELMHNAQFHAGLMDFPARVSGSEAVLLEKLLELQADLTGKKMFEEMRSRPGYQETVPPKPGLYLVMLRTSQTPEKEYIETLWSNMHTSSSGRKLFVEQIREAAHWNNVYDLQAFGNHFRRFLNGNAGDAEAVRAHFRKIINFTAMPVAADQLLRNAPVKAVPHGIAGLENGQKVRELTAGQDGITLRRFSGGMEVQQSRIPVR